VLLFSRSSCRLQPGKGNFVVRVSGVEKPIVELLEMKRPFLALKALDMDDVVARVVAAIEESQKST
jgi:hypothetical protein